MTGNIQRHIQIHFDSKVIFIEAQKYEITDFYQFYATKINFKANLFRNERSFKVGAPLNFEYFGNFSKILNIANEKSTLNISKLLRFFFQFYQKFRLAPLAFYHSLLYNAFREAKMCMAKPLQLHIYKERHFFVAKEVRIDVVSLTKKSMRSL